LKISVIGAGYVGLVTGGCLAGVGHEVVCTDNDAEKLKVLESGRLPIYEPGLDEVIERARKEGRLSFRANAAETVQYGEAIFICVGTPPLPNGSADLSAIDHVARLVATEARARGDGGGRFFASRPDRGGGRGRGGGETVERDLPAGAGEDF
jgi:UDPglucose 6-dehydrogenase